MEKYFEGLDLTALDILQRCLDGPDDLKEIEDAIQFRRDTLDRCTQQISGMPHGGSGIEDKLAELVCEIGEFEQKKMLRKREHGAEMCAGLWIVERLPAGERDVMRRIYLERKSLRAAAREMGYSESSAKRFKVSGEQKCTEMKMISMIGFLPEWYERAEFARYEKMNHDEPL